MATDFLLTVRDDKKYATQKHTQPLKPTVLSTVHSGAGDAAHMRIALLCQKCFPIDFNISLVQAGQAFPIVVFTHQLENNAQKIMDISECEISGERLQYLNEYGGNWADGYMRRVYQTERDA